MYLFSLHEIDGVLQTGISAYINNVFQACFLKLVYLGNLVNASILEKKMKNLLPALHISPLKFPSTRILFNTFSVHHGIFY